jgi:enoyl-[acyl-carrier protein] reductase I
MRGLIIGIANEHSVAYGCAKALEGDQLAITYLNDKALRFIEPLNLKAEIFHPLDVTIPGQMDALFSRIKEQWGGLDYVIHSMAFAPMNDLHGRVTDCSGNGFEQAMRISVHSLIEVTRQAELLMHGTGGSIITLTYLGSERVVPNYGIMGPCKAALESTVRYLASELGPKKITVNAISAGPLKTRAASGIKGFHDVYATAVEKAPIREYFGTHDVGAAAKFLVGARAVTGNVLFVDAGLHVL